MEVEKVARNLRKQAIFMAQNCHEPVYERSDIIRALNEGADAIEELLREKKAAPKQKYQSSEEPTMKSCCNCAHFETPRRCAPCKNCIRVSSGPRDLWEKDGDL